MPKQLPVIHDTRIVAESRLFKIEEVDLEFANGETRTYERLKGTRKRGAVMVIPFLDDETLLLIREYAVGTENYQLGFPKGLIEENETIEEAGNRELMEETGFGARDVRALRPLANAPGYMAGAMRCVVARDLFEKRLPADEPEDIEVVPWKLSDIDKLITHPDFNEARCFAGLFLIQHLEVFS